MFKNTIKFKQNLPNKRGVRKPALHVPTMNSVKDGHFMNFMSETIPHSPKNKSNTIEQFNKALSPHSGNITEYQSQISLIDKYKDGPY